MKKIIFPLLSLAFLFFATGCSEKFDVAAPYKNITVIYGLLDQADTAHYVRIQKAFLDQDKSAVNMAKTADSNFYANLNVRIDRYDFTGKYKDSIHLDRVDLNNEGYPKQPGAFFTSPNYAYKFTVFLDPRYIHRIKATNLSTGHIDSADAPIIEKQEKNGTGFYVYKIDDSAGYRSGLDFANTGPYNYVDIYGRYRPLPDFTFQGLGSPVTFAQTIIRFNWVDSNTDTHVKTARYSDYDAGFLNLVGNSFTFKILDRNLYSAIASGMQAAPDKTERHIDRCDLFVYLGTQDYYNYLQSNLTQGTGLTGSEIQPVYTNIKGANVLGLFTSRAVHAGKLTITANTIDSLVKSPYLAHTKLKGTTY